MYSKTGERTMRSSIVFVEKDGNAIPIVVVFRHQKENTNGDDESETLTRHKGSDSGNVAQNPTGQCEYF